MKSAATRRKAILILVAYHPDGCEVRKLRRCLSQLSDEIGYAVVVNDYRAGEPVDLLAEEADLVLRNKRNPGYGRAVNQVVRTLRQTERLPPYMAAVNTDLEWKNGCFESLLAWMEAHPQVVLAVPKLLNNDGEVQKLCKQNPTVLGLLSRRFVPERFKPEWLRHYDNWYIMADNDYDKVFNVPYLSGCCMLICSDAFCSVGGFDERFFLYLEDADLTRRLRGLGQAVHLPIASVIHRWGRGNHRSSRLTFVNLHSAWLYFSKWGLRFY